MDQNHTTNHHEPTPPITIDRMHEILMEIADQFPEPFYQELNGGICLLPEVKYSPHARQGDLYILGEYCFNRMGRYINLYYGSIMRAHGHRTEERLRQKLYDIVSHEFTHHLEHLSGEKGLEKKDAEDLAKYLGRGG